MNGFRVGEVVLLYRDGRKTFGVITSVELDGVGVMLPTGETVTRNESNLELPPEELRQQLNETVRRALGL
jgi:hypothetical protein